MIYLLLFYFLFFLNNSTHTHTQWRPERRRFENTHFIFPMFLQSYFVEYCSVFVKEPHGMIDERVRRTLHQIRVALIQYICIYVRSF